MVKTMNATERAEILASIKKLAATSTDEAIESFTREIDYEIALQEKRLQDFLDAKSTEIVDLISPEVVHTSFLSMCREKYQKKLADWEKSRSTRLSDLRYLEDRPQSHTTFQQSTLVDLDDAETLDDTNDTDDDDLITAITQTDLVDDEDEEPTHYPQQKRKMEPERKASTNEALQRLKNAKKQH